MCICRDQFHEPEVTKVVYIDSLNPGLIAFVTLAYGPITINSARLMRTREGHYFLAMPARKANNDTWYPTVEVDDRKLLRQFEIKAIKLYEEGIIKQESLEYVPPVCGECGHRL
jgi:hypothetical protein